MAHNTPAPSDNVAIVSYEPATGQEIWSGEPGDVDETVARARRAWAAWAIQPLATRVELMRRFANEVRKQADTLTELISRETGKPIWESRSEIEGVINKVEISVQAYAERSAQRKLNSALKGTSAIRHKPHGVMAVITPFNSPVYLPNSHIIPALIAGNAVIFKPSEKTPACAEFLVGCFHRAGVPAAVVQLLVGGAETGQALVSHTGVDGVLFTGSTQTGISINRRVANNPGKIAALQMGGNNPIVVWDTPLVPDAAVLIIQSAFTGAGQKCTSARRLIVKDTMYDAVIAEVKRLADRLIVGMPDDDPAPFMGPVIDCASADALTDSFLYFIGKGGKVIRHMTRPKDNLPFLTPGIIDITPLAERPDVELYGPLLQVIKVSSFDEAIEEANRTRFGLCATLVGGTPQDYNKFWSNVRAGTINWNRTTNGGSSSAPAGGLGLSGNHRPSAYYAADYCAYPVASTEMEQPRATVGVGFREH